ncbi:MAG: class I SAM-dependent methyltransferase [Gemmatimonadales bacterium]
MGLLEWARGYFNVRVRKDWHFRRLMETAPAMRWLNPRRGERILDIGSGDGTYDYRMARRGGRVVGFDLDRPKLRTATRHHGGKGLAYVEADASAMPVKSGWFDVVVSLCVFEHLQNDETVLAEAHRALRAGGRLLLTLDSLSRSDIPESWRDRHRIKHAVRQFYTVPAIQSKLEKNGFRLIRSRYLLSSRIDLRFIKWSYATERMRAVPAALVRTFLVTLGRWMCDVANFFSRSDGGWTLLVEASRA